MTMTIEIIQLKFNNNLIKVQKKVQCVFFWLGHEVKRKIRNNFRSNGIKYFFFVGSFINTTLIMNRDSCDSCML